MNETIKKFLDDEKITQEEYDRLFEDKSNWVGYQYSHSEIYDLPDKDFELLNENTSKLQKYQSALNKIISLQSKSEKIDLSHINFLNLNIHIKLNTIHSFSNSKFYGITSFMNTTFDKKVYFDNATFYGEAEFNHTTFKMGGSFIKTIFHDNAFFQDSVFIREMYFKGSYFEKIADFSNSTFKNLELTNTHFNLPNFNDIKSFEKYEFSSIFSNKETARIIKSHYEKHHNIIESNKYFFIEQEKYFEELSWSKDFGTKLVVGMNKLISKHSSSWLSVLIWITSFTLIVYLLHQGFPDSNKAFVELPHKAVELIDPLKMFKADDKLYEGKELWGFLVRVTTLYLFWQFITAFRQNTRRK